MPRPWRRLAIARFFSRDYKTMPHKTAIEWTDYSSNPLRAEHSGRRGWGCEKISPGCLNCYSATLNNRFGTGLDFNKAENAQAKHYLDEKELRHINLFQPKGPYRGGTSYPKVFPFDMTDIFGDWNSDETIDAAFAAFWNRSDVVFQVLTKRPERARAYLSDREARAKGIGCAAYHQFSSWFPNKAAILTNGDFVEDVADQWPLQNLWLGVSAEDQERLVKRLRVLMEIPAAIRFVSAEPLLGPLNVCAALACESCHGLGYTEPGAECDACGGASTIGLPDWVIIGGESGSGSREFLVDNCRGIVEQCKKAKVACFVKQFGSQPAAMNARGNLPGMPNKIQVLLESSKGNDPAEWDADLRVREFPAYSTISDKKIIRHA